MYKRCSISCLVVLQCNYHKGLGWASTNVRMTRGKIRELNKRISIGIKNSPWFLKMEITI